MIRHEVFTDAERQLVADRLPAVRRQLVANTRKFQQHPVPLLLAGDAYPGIWLEHNHDNLFLAPYAPEEAWASQAVFMDYQRPDGLLPFEPPPLLRPHPVLQDARHLQPRPGRLVLRALRT